MEERKIMKTKGELLSYRPDIKVVDATIRDGGLVNNFYFDDQFIKDLYLANLKAGVDYMEFGYKASKEMFDVNKFGKWKFCNDEDIRAVVGNNETDMKIAVMADVGRCDYKTDIIDKSESPIDLIRVATYINTMPTAIEMVEDAKRKGYETTCNIMAISKNTESDIDTALEMLGKSNVDGIYIVDSYGSLYPEQIRKLADKYLNVAEKYNKFIGIHAHNNQQLAFANTIEACSLGVSYLDATMSGMGRGAGNCAMELLLAFLKNPKYNLYHVLKFIEKHMLKVREEGAIWGYDIPYLLTGHLNQHPSAGIDYIKNNQTAYADFYTTLLDRD
jgi:4-hydroxy 2-oxovalerate aldolase